MEIVDITIGICYWSWLIKTTGGMHIVDSVANE